jgi:1,4-alpha-glucan branching enzyme
MHRHDAEASGFAWLIGDDRVNSVFAFLRLANGEASPVLVVCNMTPVPRQGYRVGVPSAGKWQEAINTDSQFYGGSNLGNDNAVQATEEGAHGQPYSLKLTLPPLATVMLRLEA